MKIAPTNNCFKCNPRQNINFCQIYKIPVNRNLFNSSEKIYKDFSEQMFILLNELSFKKQIESALAIKEKKGLKAFFKNFENLAKIGDELKYILDFETPGYQIYDKLQKTTGCASWWLARHLNIEEPKPLSETHHTFFLYTGKDCTNYQKVYKSKNSFTELFNKQKLVQNKILSGEYRSNDISYWPKLLLAKDFESSLCKMHTEIKPKEITIDSANDLHKIFDDLDNIIKFDN